MHTRALLPLPVLLAGMACCGSPKSVETGGEGATSAPDNPAVEATAGEEAGAADEGEDGAGPQGASGADASDGSAAAPGATLTAVACSWGGTGPQPAEGAPGVWYVLLVDLAAVTALEDFDLASFELLDGTGGVVARGLAPAELRVAPSDRTARDLSAYGTEPFDGAAAGNTVVRLWVHGALDVSPAEVGMPTRCRAEFTAANGRRFEVTGSSGGPWPTAGPAPAGGRK